MTAQSWIMGYGTRPEVMKLNPVLRALRARGASVEVWHTGQHTSLLAATADTVRHQAFVAESKHLELRPSNDPVEFAAAVTSRVGQELKRLPGCTGMIVEGDTASVYGCALAAQQAGIPVAHVEAGVRSGDRANPWPEEQFRTVVDRVATWCFAPTEHCAQRLNEEGKMGEVYVTGNPGIDDLWTDIVFPRRSSGHVLLTLHRRETLKGLPEIVDQLDWLASHRPEVAFVWPVHPNPAVRGAAARAQHIHTVPPLGVRTFRRLLAAARLVVTDSGGVQEEAAALGVPCLICRQVTDRPESVALGIAAVIGTSPADVAAAVLAELEHPRLGRNPSDCFGDGNAGKRIAAILVPTTAGERPSGDAQPELGALPSAA